jgi:mucin-2
MQVTPANGSTRTFCTSEASFDLMTLLTGAQLGGVWTVDGNPVASTTFNPATSPAGTYRYTVTSPGCTADTEDFEDIVINKTQAPNAGADGTRNVCISDISSLTAINLYGLLQGTPAATGTWDGPTPTSGGHLGTVDLSGLTVGSYVYTYTVAGSGACTEASRTVTIFIDDLPNAGTVNATNRAYCSNEGILDLNSLLDNEQAGGVWTNASSQVVASQLDLSTANSGDYTYTVISLGCGGQEDSRTVTLTIQQAPNAGTALAPARVCISNVNSTSINLFTLLGNNPATNGTWLPRTGVTGEGNSAVLNLAGFAAGRYEYTYSVAGAGACATSPDTEPVVIFVEPLSPNEGTVISTTNIVCASQAPFDLHDLLQGEDLGGTWYFNTAPLVSTIFNPASSPAGTYSYRISSSSCGGGNERQRDVAIQVRNVLPELTSLSLASQRVCSGTSATINFEGVADAVVTYQINGGANQTVQLNGSGTASVQTGALSSNITVRATSVAYPGPLSCTQPVAGVADVTVIVESNNPNPGTVISPVNVVCSSQAAFDLHDLLQGEDLGGQWSVNGNVLASSTFDPATSIAGTYQYLLNSTSCGATANRQFEIRISNDLPTVTSLVATSTSVCSGNSTSVTFNGSPDAVVTYQINGIGNQTVALNASGVGVVTTNNLSAATTYKAISVAYPGPLACSQSAVATAETTITIDALPTATISGTQSVCEGSNPTLTITGTPNAVVIYRIGSGNEIDLNLGATGTQTITINNIQDTATYTLVRATSDKNCPQVISNQSATITVNKFVNPVINASSLTVCNGSVGNLVITPNVANALATLTYNIDGGANQTVVLDAAGTATIITGALNQNAIINLLRLQTAIDCARDLVNVSFPITVTPLPTVTSFDASNTKVCSGGNSIVTVQGTPNATVTYNNGTANNTVVLNSSGVATIALNNITSDISLTLVSIANSCPNSATGSVSVEVIPLPNVAAANVSISSSTVCYETSNTVSISNATDLDGDYIINYTLSGAISLSRSATVNFAGGAGSFVINSSDINASGTVTVTIQDIASVSTGCSVSGATFNNTVNFTVYPQVPAATLKPKGEAFCSKESPIVGALTARLNLAQGTAVNWYDLPTGGTPLADNTSLINGMSYYAEIESISNGCTISSRLEVIVDTNKCLFIPEGFSPNDDGINDLLVFENLDFYYPDYTVEIYNRYGNKLYTGNAQSRPWDGRAGHGRIGSDDILPTGVYFYILNYNVAGKEAKQGVIYLSR